MSNGCNTSSLRLFEWFFRELPKYDIEKDNEYKLLDFISKRLQTNMIQIKTSGSLPYTKRSSAICFNFDDILLKKIIGQWRENIIQLKREESCVLGKFADLWYEVYNDIKSPSMFACLPVLAFGVKNNEELMMSSYPIWGTFWNRDKDNIQRLRFEDKQKIYPADYLDYKNVQKMKHCMKYGKCIPFSNKIYSNILKNYEVHLRRFYKVIPGSDYPFSFFSIPILTTGKGNQVSNVLSFEMCWYGKPIPSKALLGLGEIRDFVTTQLANIKLGKYIKRQKESFAHSMVDYVDYPLDVLLECKQSCQNVNKDRLDVALMSQYTIKGFFDMWRGFDLQAEKITSLDLTNSFLVLRFALHRKIKKRIDDPNRQLDSSLDLEEDQELKQILCDEATTGESHDGHDLWMTEIHDSINLLASKYGNLEDIMTKWNSPISIVLMAVLKQACYHTLIYNRFKRMKGLYSDIIAIDKILSIDCDSKFAVQITNPIIKSNKVGDNVISESLDFVELKEYENKFRTIASDSWTGFRWNVVNQESVIRLDFTQFIEINRDITYE